MKECVEDFETCKACGGECCKSLAIEIPAPKDVDDFQDLKWYLYHTGLTVYLDKDGEWNVEVHLKCKYLDKDGKCTIYGERPPVCRAFEVVGCNNGDDRVVWLKTPEDVDAYVAKLKDEGKLN
ncbi:YkgJ family cysteine cluster protein [Candidatus Woesearchaeota archaeon]|nr:YkgJ family cysteine cluster protein [Candidatus Woesearchaeota archaeon]